MQWNHNFPTKLKVGRNHKRKRIRWHKELKHILCEQQNHKCCYCGKTMQANGISNDYPTFEHVRPLSLGGADELENIVVVCRGCNEDKAVIERVQRKIMWKFCIFLSIQKIRGA